jgi:hypothetical protein
MVKEMVGMYLSKVAVFLLLMSTALFWSACEEEKKLQPCPAQGLGVVSASGKTCSEIKDPLDEDLSDCQDQMENFMDYDCAEPQICPDHGAHQMPYHVLKPSGPGETLSFALTNCTTGNDKLILDKVELTGDERCSFVFNKTTDVQDYEIPAGETRAIQLVYKPKSLGEDHVHLRITANAQNFPDLVLPICGRANPDTSGTDAGVSAADGGSENGTFPCKDDPNPKVYPCP